MHIPLLRETFETVYLLTACNLWLIRPNHGLILESTSYGSDEANTFSDCFSRNKLLEMNLFVFAFSKILYLERKEIMESSSLGSIISLNLTYPADKSQRSPMLSSSISKMFLLFPTYEVQGIFIPISCANTHQT